MSSSSEPRPSYVPLEYREAGEEPSSGTSTTAPSEPEEPKPDPAALYAAQLEQERKAITAQLRRDAEREVQNARAAVARAVEEFANRREEYFRNVESEVVSLALAIARRVIHRETQLDPRLLAALVRYELEQLDAATSVRLLVPAEALNQWREVAATMPRRVEVTTDASLQANEVKIATELGETTINFEGELKEIERGFFDLLAHRTASIAPAAETNPVRVQ